MGVLLRVESRRKRLADLHLHIGRLDYSTGSPRHCEIGGCDNGPNHECDCREEAEDVL